MRIFSRFMYFKILTLNSMRIFLNRCNKRIAQLLLCVKRAVSGTSLNIKVFHTSQVLQIVVGVQDEFIEPPTVLISKGYP